MKPDELDSETRQKIVANLRTLHVSQGEVQTALVALHAKMREEERPVQGTRVRQRQLSARAKPNWQWRLGLTVGVAAAAVVSFFSWQARPEIPQAQEALASSVYTTAKGERATITLPDGSTVQLNVASRLEVPADYLEGNRNVRLEGEAMFTVSHRAASPFLVIAGPSTTRVLGTKFVVRHYATDSTAFVAVKEGRVAVQSKILSASQEIRVGQHDVSPVVATTSARFSFTTGVLDLEKMPLARAIPELNRWYNAEIRTTDPALASRQIAGGFVAGSLEALEEILTLTLNCRVVRQGHVITLYSR